MSFRAIYTDKHGNKELIKLPWYAAFGPTPRKKVQPKTCATCKGQGTVPCSTCKGQGTITQPAANTGQKLTGAQRFSAHDKETYSKADNKKIMALKKEGKPWKEIMEAIDKQSQSQLKEHYKKNLADKVEGAGGAGNEGNTGGNGFSNRPKEEYSKGNDKTIIQMKSAGKDWRDILAAIGKQSKSQLQAHWKDNLQQRAEGGQGGGGSTKSSDDQDRDHDYWAEQAAEHFQQTGRRITIAQAKRLYADD